MTPDSAKMMMAVNEVFAIRDNETMFLREQRPTSGRIIAVMARSVQMPPGEKCPVRQTDGAPIEMAAIVACQINADGLWQWVQLSPPTKENVGDLLFDGGAERDRWYYLDLE